MPTAAVFQRPLRYQTGVLRLGWWDRWDTAFLLDVPEHIPGDADESTLSNQASECGLAKVSCKSDSRLNKKCTIAKVDR
jgi:hypothetical protein